MTWAGTRLAPPRAMSTLPPDQGAHARKIGQLCVGADWACVHGDLVALQHIAEQLAGYASEPLHCDLETLAELCDSDPARAIAEWSQLKERLYRDPGVKPS